MSTTTGVGRFVGRGQELERAELALAAAQAGRGSVFVLEGAPGIGKSRTAREVAERARRRGATVLSGRSFGDGWSPAYGPWIEALESYLDGLPPQHRRARIGDDAAVLAQLIPDVQGPSVAASGLTELHADHERLRLHQAVLRLLGRASVDPLVIVLDDLHWADADTLELLRDAARGLRNARILIVVTQRELELTHPVEQLLAELQREQAVERLALGPLTVEQTRTLVEFLAEEPVTQVLAEGIHARTGGVPLFVQEIVRHARQGRGGLGAFDPTHVPQTVRAAIGLRFGRLSQAAASVLRAASAFTGAFDLRVMQELTSLLETEVLDAFEEALRESMIVARDPALETYEFAHGIVRDVLYSELTPSRAVRLHRRVAHALESVHRGREHEHAAELAHQYHRSAALPGSAHGLGYALAAADQARAAYAFGREAVMLRMALDLAADAEAPTRATVLRRLALAETDALEIAAANVSIAAALRELHAAGSPSLQIADFVADAAWALKNAGAGEDVVAPLVSEGVSLLGGDQNLTWARLKLTLTGVERLELAGLRYGRWIGFDPRAVEIARRDGDERDYARTLEPMDWRTTSEIDALRERVQGWRSAAARMHGLEVVARSYLFRQHSFRPAATVCSELLDESRRQRSVTAEATALVLQAHARLWLGEIDAGRRSISDAADLVAALGPGHRLHNFLASAEEFLASFVGGDWESIATANLASLDDPGFGWPWIQLGNVARAARAYAEVGRRREAVQLLELVTPALERQDPKHMGALVQVTDGARAIWLLELDDWAARYLVLANRLVEIGRSELAEHPAACMASLLGLDTEASMHFEKARMVMAERGARPRCAVVDFDAACALDRAGAPGAAELLAAARSEFDAMGLTIWVERADEFAARLRSPRLPDGLTRRECEVLVLLAAGQTNKQIASELVLSVHTVERHVANAYRKVHAHNRADAAAYVVRHGL